MQIPDKDYSLILRSTPGSSIYPDAGIRWEPPSTPLPENLGYSLAPNSHVSKLVFLHRTAYQYVIASQSQLLELDFPLLLTATNGVQITGCPALATVSLPRFVPTNTSTISFNGGALTAASVNAILAAAVANTAYVSGTINLSGGTNAAPTGQGITDKATLIGRGVSVTTN